MEAFHRNRGHQQHLDELRDPPSRHAVHITALGSGEVRPVVRLDPDADANVVLVQQDAEGYATLIVARWSDDDPTRSQSQWKRATDLYDLYLDIAWSSQVWGWADPEIVLFFPTPPARILTQGLRGTSRKRW